MSRLLKQQCQQQGITHPAVLRAIEDTDRSLFVPDTMTPHADLNRPLPIGYEQTISQPFIVAKMTELLLENSAMKSVLEIGTGSGYQAAILSHCVKHVFTVERIKPLHAQARRRLRSLNYNNIKTHYGDGTFGWQAHAPFDGIIITAATATVPDALLKQLNTHGRLVAPRGSPNISQRLCVIRKRNNGIETAYHETVIFVPLLKGKSD